MEAQRYPEDFDGISAGDPAMYFQVQNSLNHAWTQAENTRADGTKILERGKLEVLHAAVINHCDALDGIKDGLLSDPRACKVDPEWVRCPAGAADPASCLNSEEWTTASKLYMGPTDAQGHHFLPGGWEPGSELTWAGGMPGGGPRAPQQPAVNTGQGVLPAAMQQRPPGGPGSGMVASMAPVVFPVAAPANTNIKDYPFTLGQFQRVSRGT